MDHLVIRCQKIVKNQQSLKHKVKPFICLFKHIHIQVLKDTFLKWEPVNVFFFCFILIKFKKSILINALNISCSQGRGLKIINIFVSSPLSWSHNICSVSQSMQREEDKDIMIRNITRITLLLLCLSCTFHFKRFTKSQNPLYPFLYS